MKLFGCQWLVASSLLLGLVSANAETRPQYGGTLHITMHQSANSLDPADRSTPDSVGRRSIASLIFDTLITTDDIGRMQPALAESWQFTGGTQRALFRLRRNIRFHDGTALTAEAVAASLRFANPAWNVLASGDTVVIEKDAAGGSLLAELALPRNSIVKRDSADGKLVGTGPFILGAGIQERSWY